MQLQDGTTGGLIKDSDVCIDGTNNITGAKSISFVNSASNLVAAGTVWFKASSGILNIGNNKVIDNNIAQTLANKTLTIPNISTISNAGTITLPTTTTKFRY
jgi:hypothetical protein